MEELMPTPAAKPPRKPKAWTPPPGSARLSVWVDEELLWSVRQAAAAEKMTVRRWMTRLVHDALRRRHGRPA
jgi:hypothetical protein